MSELPPQEQLPAGQLYRLAWVFYLLLALGGVLWIGIREQRIGLELFVAADWWLDLLLGLATAALLLGLWAIAEHTLDDARRLFELLRERLRPLERSEAVALALLSGFAEEFFFRGAVQGSFGIFWATLLFALLHTGRARELRLWTLFALVAGAAFGGLVLWRQNLLAAVVAHATVNAVSLLRVASQGGGEASEATHR